jgi:hypothetical protein
MKQVLKLVLNWKFAISFLFTVSFLIVLYKLQLNKNLLFIVINLLFCSALYLMRSTKYLSHVTGVFGGIITVVSGYYLVAFYPHFNDIIEWDFLAFYVFGKASADGLALYDPASFTNMMTAIHLPYTASESFNIYVIKVGVCYPPTSMIMLAPFGTLDLQTANIAWRIFVLGFLMADIILIYKMFSLNQSKFLSFFIVVLLMLALHGSYTTVALSQTNFFLLFFILLIYKNPDNWKAGMFMALAMIVKPIAVIWSLYFIINRKWKPLISMVITGIIILIVTVLMFGMDNFLAFFTSSPALRLPATVYSETINQSMNAVLIRTSQNLGLDILVAHMNLIVLSISALLFALTCYASYKLRKTDLNASFLIFLPFSLLIYPGCLTHYAVQLLPLFFAMILMKNKTSLLWFTAFLLVLSVSSFVACFFILIVFLAYAFLEIPVFTSSRIDTSLTS